MVRKRDYQGKRVNPPDAYRPSNQGNHSLVVVVVVSSNLFIHISHMSTINSF